MTVTQKVRALVIARDQWRCQWCGVDLEARISAGGYSLQHRRARGMGGTGKTDADQPQNLVLMCGSGTTGCHGYVEEHREESRHRGFTLYQGDDPAHIGIWGYDGGWILNPDGTREAVA